MEQRTAALAVLADVQSLRSFLKSEMSIDSSTGGAVIAIVKVLNDAPLSKDAGDVVFVGVGLRIIDGQLRAGQRGSEWPSRISKSRSPTQGRSVGRYDEGTWFGGKGDSFPAFTSDEQSHGEMLFPGERLEYQISLNTNDLPYLDIRVEGSLSRRHLLHISQPMEALKTWTQPLLSETFLSLDSIDLFGTLTSFAAGMPVFGPETTIAVINGCREAVGKTEDHVRGVLLALKDIKYPNRMIAEWAEDTRQYLKSFFQAFNAIKEALAGSDTNTMRAAVEEVAARTLKAEDLKRRLTELKTIFGIDS